MKFELKISDKGIFEKAYANLNSFVQSKVKAEFKSDDSVEISSDESDNYKWHLVTLGSLYGGEVFKNNHELSLIEHSSVDIEIPQPFSSNEIKLISNRGEKLIFNPYYLNLSEAYMVNKLESVLNNMDKLKIQNLVTSFNFQQKISFELPIKHAYQIIDQTLIIIKKEAGIFTITNLWKTKWNEI